MKLKKYNWNKSSDHKQLSQPENLPNKLGWTSSTDFTKTAKQTELDS